MHFFASDMGVDVNKQTVTCLSNVGSPDNVIIKQRVALWCLVAWQLMFRQRDQRKLVELHFVWNVSPGILERYSQPAFCHSIESS